MPNPVLFYHKRQWHYAFSNTSDVGFFMKVGDKSFNPRSSECVFQGMKGLQENGEFEPDAIGVLSDFNQQPNANPKYDTRVARLNGKFKSNPGETGGYSQRYATSNPHIKKYFVGFPAAAGVIRPKYNEQTKAVDLSRNENNIAYSLKEEVMYQTLLCKYTQNPQVLNALLATRDEPIIENTAAASYEDSFWGNGKNIPGVNGTGRNALGRLLMALREQLRDELKNGGIRVRYGFDSALTKALGVKVQPGVIIDPFTLPTGETAQVITQADLMRIPAIHTTSDDHRLTRGKVYANLQSGFPAALPEAQVPSYMTSFSQVQAQGAVAAYGWQHPQGQVAALAFGKYATAAVDTVLGHTGAIALKIAEDQDKKNNPGGMVLKLKFNNATEAGSFASRVNQSVANQSRASQGLNKIILKAKGEFVIMNRDTAEIFFGFEGIVKFGKAGGLMFDKLEKQQQPPTQQTAASAGVAVAQHSHQQSLPPLHPSNNNPARIVPKLPTTQAPSQPQPGHKGKLSQALQFSQPPMMSLENGVRLESAKATVLVHTGAIGISVEPDGTSSSSGVKSLRLVFGTEQEASNFSVEALSISGVIVDSLQHKAGSNVVTMSAAAAETFFLHRGIQHSASGQRETFDVLVEELEQEKKLSVPQVSQQKQQIGSANRSQAGTATTGASQFTQPGRPSVNPPVRDLSEAFDRVNSLLGKNGEDSWNIVRDANGAYGLELRIPKPENDVTVVFLTNVLKKLRSLGVDGAIDTRSNTGLQRNIDVITLTHAQTFGNNSSSTGSPATGGLFNQTHPELVSELIKAEIDRDYPGMLDKLQSAKCTKFELSNSPNANAEKGEVFLQLGMTFETEKQRQEAIDGLKAIFRKEFNIEWNPDSKWQNKLSGDGYVLHLKHVESAVLLGLTDKNRIPALASLQNLSEAYSKQRELEARFSKQTSASTGAVATGHSPQPSSSNNNNAGLTRQGGGMVDKLRGEVNPAPSHLATGLRAQVSKTRQQVTPEQQQEVIGILSTACKLEGKPATTATEAILRSVVGAQSFSVEDDKFVEGKKVLKIKFPDAAAAAAYAGSIGSETYTKTKTKKELGPNVVLLGEDMVGWQFGGRTETSGQENQSKILDVLSLEAWQQVASHQQQPLTSAPPPPLPPQQTAASAGPSSSTNNNGSLSAQQQFQDQMKHTQWFGNEGGSDAGGVTQQSTFDNRATVKALPPHQFYPTVEEQNRARAVEEQRRRTDAAARANVSVSGSPPPAPGATSHMQRLAEKRGDTTVFGAADCSSPSHVERTMKPSSKGGGSAAIGR